MIYVRDVMTGNVRTIPVKATVREAAKEMVRWKIGSLVIADGKKPVGIITEGDISKAVARGLDPAKTLVSVKKKKLITVEPGVRIEVAAKMMASSGVKKLPVIEGTDLVGIITQTDIVNSSFVLVTSLKEMVQARYRPPDFEM
ncbi:MAG: CBS domain-containing protein [Nitrososphaerales archaeon]